MKIEPIVKNEYPLYGLQLNCVKKSHTIILEQPAGRVSKGVCIHCNSEGTYPNSTIPMKRNY